MVRAAVAEIDPAIVVDVMEAPAQASLDPLRVHQAVANLVRNAVQAGGTVGPRVRVRAEGDVLVIEVRDHGGGLPPEQSERLFDTFYTTRTRGTGLGLSLVRRVAALHGGSVEAANHPDGGALFTVRIPVEEP